MENTKKKIALISGGSSGIGRQVCVKLAERGYLAVFTYQNPDGAKETMRRIREAGGSGFSLRYNLRECSGAARLVEETENRFGQIDLLVNCAGISNTKKIDEIDEAEWDTMLDVNLKGTFFLSQAVFRKMRERRRGRIVTITSIAGERGGRFSGIHYSISKAGLECMVKSLALLGAEYGITSNGVSPGVIDTPMSRREGISSDDVPLGRAGTPDDVAGAVCFLASDEASYITGQTIDVNGGQYMR
ncbi:MAG: SDR family NAD(P)-dependent oxidoreductase [Bilifractor sp.]|jgi:3-oxoacyl-[acyl-carrier protein] reductase